MKMKSQRSDCNRKEDWKLTELCRVFIFFTCLRVWSEDVALCRHDETRRHINL
jgi:hypothetical protein